MGHQDLTSRMGLLHLGNHLHNDHGLCHLSSSPNQVGTSKKQRANFRQDWLHIYCQHDRKCCLVAYLWSRQQILLRSVILRYRFALRHQFTGVVILRLADANKLTGICEHVFLRGTFSIYMGWVTAATILNIAFMLKSWGLKGDFE